MSTPYKTKTQKKTNSAFRPAASAEQDPTSKGASLMPPPISWASSAVQKKRNKDEASKKENNAGHASIKGDQTTAEEDKFGDGSMLTLSGVVAPKGGKQGKAAIKITMSYKTVTEGLGMVNKDGLIDSAGFKSLYAKGNQTIKMKQLPAADKTCSTLTKEEVKQSKEIDATTGNPKFSNYYDVKVEYDYSVSKGAGESLWDVMKWEMEEEQNRGGFFEPFKLDGTDDLRNAKDNKNSIINKKKREIKTNEKLKDKDKRKSKDEIAKEAEEYQKGLVNEAAQKNNIHMMRYVFLNMVKDNKTRFENKSILIDKKFAKLMKTDAAITTELTTLKSELIGKKEAATKEKVEDIEAEFLNYFKRMNTVYRFGESKAKKEWKSGESKIGAAGILNNPNYVVLSPDLYGATAPATFSFGGMSSAELLAHEAGHNAAEDFSHTAKGNGKYEYKQTGLQSNQKGKVYPTLENTLGILNDPKNRKFMTIL